MPFAPQVRDDALVASGRHCCLCHKFCGIKMELHHIDQKSEGGLDTFDNCIPLCLDCHADIRSYDHNHPKGIKYTPRELRIHRDNWYKKVSAPTTIYCNTSGQIDGAVFSNIVSLLPYRKCVSVIEFHDFGAPFRASLFAEIDGFLRANEDPSLEFIDADLEGMRGTLVDNVATFVEYLAKHTWPLRVDSLSEHRLQSVPSEWEDAQPERFLRTVDKINALSREVAVSYRSLVREARRRLGVSGDADGDNRK